MPASRVEHVPDLLMMLGLLLILEGIGAFVLPASATAVDHRHSRSARVRVES